MQPVAIDFETYYEQKANDGYTLSNLGAWEYCFDPRFDAYLMSMYDGVNQWVGHPREFEWDFLRGKTLLTHNSNFDGVVMISLALNGTIPKWVADKWKVNLPILDTADMTAYLRIMRNLEDAAKYLLGEKLDKGPRDMMKCLHWAPPGPGEEELHRSYHDPDSKNPFEWRMPTDEQRATFLKYAMTDAVTCYRLFEAAGKFWPEHERRLSEWQRNAGWKGVYVNLSYAKECVGKLEDVLFTAGREIPWSWGQGTKHKTPLVRARAIHECLKTGIPAPFTFAKDKPEYLVWEAKYGEKVKWVGHLRDWRRSNSFLKKFRTIVRRVRDDGTVPYTMKYCEAHTGRPGATEDLNLLNLDSKPKYGCDIRRVFCARPGKVLCIMDQSQIEPRALNWLVGNKEFLELVRSGQDPYEAHARLTMNWTGGDLAEAGKTDKNAKRLRDTSKGRVLAGGYGCGFVKFMNMLPRYGIDPDVVFSDPVTVVDEQRLRDWLTAAKMSVQLKEFDALCGTYLNTEEVDAAAPATGKVPRYTEEAKAEAAKLRRWWINSWLQIQAYRASNPKIVGFWRQLGAAALEAAQRGEQFCITLPSGRKLTYAKPFMRNGEIWAWTIRGDVPSKLYGGLLAENVTQSLAREIFSYGLLRLLDNGVDVLWTIYDEWVTEIDEMVLALQSSADRLDRLKAIVSETPPWVPGLPLAVSQELSPFYKK